MKTRDSCITGNFTKQKVIFLIHVLKETAVKTFRDTRSIRHGKCSKYASKYFELAMHFLIRKCRGIFAELTDPGIHLVDRGGGAFVNLCCLWIRTKVYIGYRSRKLWSVANINVHKTSISIGIDTSNYKTEWQAVSNRIDSSPQILMIRTPCVHAVHERGERLVGVGCEYVQPTPVMTCRNCITADVYRSAVLWPRNLDLPAIENICISRFRYYRSLFEIRRSDDMARWNGCWRGNRTQNTFLESQGHLRMISPKNKCSICISLYY